MQPFINNYTTEDELVYYIIEWMKYKLKSKYQCLENKPIIYNAIDYLIQNFNNPKCNVKSMKTTLHIRSHKFEKLFFDKTNFLPKSFLTMARLTAATLLIGKKITLKNIYFYSGFHTYRNMVNAMKKYIKYNPKHFRDNFNKVLLEWSKEINYRNKNTSGGIYCTF